MSEHHRSLCSLVSSLPSAASVKVKTLILTSVVMSEAKDEASDDTSPPQADDDTLTLSRGAQNETGR